MSISNWEAEIERLRKRKIGALEQRNGVYASYLRRRIKVFEMLIINERKRLRNIAEARERQLKLQQASGWYEGGKHV